MIMSIQWDRGGYRQDGSPSMSLNSRTNPQILPKAGFDPPDIQPKHPTEYCQL